MEKPEETLAKPNAKIEVIYNLIWQHRTGENPSDFCLKIECDDGMQRFLHNRTYSLSLHPLTLFQFYSLTAPTLPTKPEVTLIICPFLPASKLRWAPIHERGSWDLPLFFPGKNTGVGCHFLLQGIFPTQGLNPGSPMLQADALPSEPPGKPPGIHVILHKFCKALMFKLSNKYVC